MSKTIAINAGSSSLKWKLYEMPEEKELASGIVERIGMEDAIFSIRALNGVKSDEIGPVFNHDEAVRKLLVALKENEIIVSFEAITGIGHRVVAGGEIFKESTLVTEDVIQTVKDLSELAPLHNPPNAVAMEAFYKILPNVKSVAVFDTSFHQTMEPVHFLYSLPMEYYENFKIRKYGAHGISHEYVAHRTAAVLKKPLSELKVITCHLGNGCSITAIENGQSVDTSMGFTPLAGVTMGTRTGDIDASVIPFLMEKLGTTDVHEIIRIFNKESGLKGLSGISNDMRDIKEAESKNTRAETAIAIFIDRIVKYIGMYIATMNGVDAIVFTAGMGERAPWLRSRIAEKLAFIGTQIDQTVNEQATGETILSTDESKVKLVMIPTNEEVMIAREVEKFKG